MDAKKDERDEFKRENRYFVFKISDLIKLTPTAQEYLAAIGREVAAIREEAGKQPLECVVIESDWPEYEPAWRMVQGRVSGSAALAQPAQGEVIGYVLENYAEFYAKHGQTVMTQEPDKYRIPVYASPQPPADTIAVPRSEWDELQRYKSMWASGLTIKSTGEDV